MVERSSDEFFLKHALEVTKEHLSSEWIGGYDPVIVALLRILLCNEKNYKYVCNGGGKDRCTVFHLDLGSIGSNLYCLLDRDCSITFESVMLTGNW